MNLSKYHNYETFLFFVLLQDRDSRSPDHSDKNYDPTKHLTSKDLWGAKL